LFTKSAALFEINTQKYKVLSTDRFHISQDDKSLVLTFTQNMRKWHEMYLINLSRKQAELCQCIPLTFRENVKLLAERFENKDKKSREQQ
jgi:hypothetical protein